MSKATLTLKQFAFDLGSHQRITREVSEVWHKQYSKADAATRQAMREDFLSEFIRGYADCTEKQAMRILITVRGERKASEQQAYEAASQKFLYHIARTGTKDQRKEPKRIRFTSEQRKAGDEFLATFPGETLAEQIAKARAFLASLA